jgi:hypothetical protein
MISQSSNNVETGVDRLLVFLRGKGQVSIKDLAKQLNVSEEVAQTWSDFLVEEKILGMEYKFTNAYVYLLKDTKNEEASEKDLREYKKEFETEAKNKNIPENTTAYLWKQEVQRHLDTMKTFFYEEANKRGLRKIDPLWTEYQNRILGILGE